MIRLSEPDLIAMKTRWKQVLEELEGEEGRKVTGGRGTNDYRDSGIIWRPKDCRLWNTKLLKSINTVSNSSSCSFGNKTLYLQSTDFGAEVLRRRDPKQRNRKDVYIWGSSTYICLLCSRGGRRTQKLYWSKSRATSKSKQYLCQKFLE